jgi:hypothetical protein
MRRTIEARRGDVMHYTRGYCKAGTARPRGTKRVRRMELLLQRRPNAKRPGSAAGPSLEKKTSSDYSPLRGEPGLMFVLRPVVPAPVESPG